MIVLMNRMRSTDGYLALIHEDGELFQWSIQLMASQLRTVVPTCIVNYDAAARGPFVGVPRYVSEAEAVILTRQPAPACWAALRELVRATVDQVLDPDEEVTDVH